MTVLDTALDPRSAPYLDARGAMLQGMAELATALDAVREAGGERAVTRHHARGKLLARERIELLVDRDSPLLELSPAAGWGTPAPVGAGLVTAIGVVEQRICVLVASEPTVRGGVVGEATLRKLQRAQQIAYQNRLPMINLLESSGVDPAEQYPAHLQMGQVVADYARLAAARIPTVGVFVGPRSELAGIDLAPSLDQLITMRPLITDRPVDHVAEEDRDAVRLARQCVRRWPAGTGTDRPPAPVAVPKHDPEDLLAAPVRQPREILGRLLDGSEFDESHPGYGTGLCTGWGGLHGHPVAVVAYTGGPTGGAEADKASRLVERAGHAGTPVVFLPHGNATAAEPTITTAVVRARVPALVVRVAGGHGPAAVAAVARFRFCWPATGGAGGGDPDGSALSGSGQLADDGVIDPRDTRTVLGLCLSAIRCGQQ
jgi:acetyl-CoA carboxylase carboxyltransferase component